MLSKAEQKPVLLCLTGWGFDQTVWSDVTARLATSFECVTDDLSHLSDGSNLQAWADAVLAKLPDTVYVLGWSLGGTLGMWLAAHYPNRVQAVCVLSGSPFFPADKAWPGVSRDRLLVIESSCQTECDAFLSDFIRWQVSMRDRSVMKSLKQSLLSAKQQTALTVALRWLMTVDCRDVMDTCYFLLAEHDKILPTAGLIHALPTAQVQVVEGAGHALPVTHPDRVSAWVKEVLHV